MLRKKLCFPSLSSPRSLRLTFRGEEEEEKAEEEEEEEEEKGLFITATITIDNVMQINISDGFVLIMSGFWRGGV